MQRALFLVALVACGDRTVPDLNVTITLGDTPETSAVSAEVLAFQCEGSVEEDNIECDPVPGLHFEMGTVGDTNTTFEDNDDGTYSAELTGYHETYEVLFDGEGAVTRHHYALRTFFTGQIVALGNGLVRASWTPDPQAAHYGDCMQVQQLTADGANLGFTPVPDCADEVIVQLYQGAAKLRLTTSMLDFGENIEDPNDRYVQGWFDIQRDLLLP
jgi:hypothetical protein